MVKIERRCQKCGKVMNEFNSWIETNNGNKVKFIQFVCSDDGAEKIVMRSD